MRLHKKMFAGVAVSALAFGLVVTPASEAATKPTLTIWADPAKVPALVAAAKGYKAATLKIVAHDFGKIRDDLKTVAAKDAPDIIEGAHDWVGELASNGMAVKLSLPAPVKKQFLANDISAMTYQKNLYGLPLNHESIAFVQNTDMVGTKCFTTLTAAVAKANTVNGLTTPIQVGPDAYHFYPMMTGLGGAFFKRNADGSYDPNSVQVDARALLKNAGIIESWQASGLFQNYAGNYDGETGLFATGKAAFWITGPWNSGVLDKIKGTIHTKTCAFPTIVKGIKSYPFSGVRGLMITKFANTHKVLPAAKAALISWFSTSKVQTTFGSKNNVNPANVKSVNSNKFTNGFQITAPDATPMPNIPEMAAVWGAVSDAWAKALKAVDPTAAKTAFLQGASQIRDQISN